MSPRSTNLPEKNKTGERVLKGVFPKIGVPQNGWYIMENPMNKWMIWGENPLFLETPKVSFCEEKGPKLVAIKNFASSGRVMAALRGVF